MVQAYGLDNIIYFPQSGTAGFDARSAAFLSFAGLPRSEVFTSREDVEDPYPADLDAVTLGSRFDHCGMPCLAESRPWWMLGYLFTSLIALDPTPGKVYAFPEGSDGYIPLHRDVESLVYALVEFRKLEIDHDYDVDPEELSARFKETADAFDPALFADDDSQWTSHWKSWNTASGNPAHPNELYRERTHSWEGHTHPVG
ncbi:MULTISPECIES: SUKH-4 family immunity protein [Streptomyces]|uniref:SUKH-4 family immunity protein n=1 Tax=Streptomyces TaxID=1883 RepID=UPI001EFE40C9|nr:MULTISPECIES: SUKH-4 family immunity protein [Streptomyces]MDI7787904.1 SUKH-4 family immunity protein [Streptomyces cavourensis]